MDVSEHRRARIDRIVDVATVILISLASVATAWCGYQAARWSALQALSYSLANAARIDQSTAASLANAQRIVDVGLFVQYEQAIYRKDSAFAQFIKRRFRPEFRTAVEAWLKTNPQSNRNAPLSPFAMRQYRLKADDDSTAAGNRAETLLAKAVQSNETSDQYVFLTVLFASATFLGGVAMKARYPWHLVLTIVGAALFLFSFVRLWEHPVR